MVKLLAILVMGGIGSICRYLLGGWLQESLTKHRIFPIGTMIVNLLGCLLIGVLAGAFDSRRVGENMRVALMVGFLGGFTTFSSFGLETVRLLNDGEFFPASLNIIISVVGGLALVWLGLRVSQHYLGT